jgi:shikimate kinase
LRRLVNERYPVYAEADVTVHSQDVAHEAIVADILAALAARLQSA